MDSSGNLYGTRWGGSASATARCSSWPRAAARSPRWPSFNGTNGQGPEGGVIMDSSGNLYGTTYQGGPFGDGTVFELAQGSGTITTLASCVNNGVGPSRLVMDSSRQPVRHNELSEAHPTTARCSSWPRAAVRSPRSPCSTASTVPTQVAGVIMDSSGNLYGTTAGGGAFGDGTVFELAAGSGTIITLASFNGTDGANPRWRRDHGQSGNLYGTTSKGSASPGRHGVRAGARQRHHHHAGLVQWQRRRKPECRP